MSYSRKALLSSLLVAALAVPAGAQAPAVTPTDSVAKDSTAPVAKKSRFGGMMNKAKAVAGNKAVQGAVKGAAANVACNAVPGAAVAAAAAGNAACQNTLMGQVVKKGMAGTAAAMAGNVASGAAGDAASKLTGVKGAAAAGAIGAVTGGHVSTGGLSGAAAAVAGSKVSGLGNAAAAAAAGKLMGKGAAATTGVTNAAAMAAAQAAAARMAPNGGALPNGATPSAADMAAAVAAMNAMGGAMAAGATGGKKVDVVDFRELKGMLPATLSGLKRTEATGEKTGAMGITVSSAEGSYSSEDGKSISVKLADIGSLSGIAGMAAYAWAAHEIDREGDNEYEKTTTFKGHKALEKYNKNSKSGEFSVLVGGRFVVGAEGSNVSMDALKAAVGSVDLRKLDGMKGKGVH